MCIGVLCVLSHLAIIMTQRYLLILSILELTAWGIKLLSQAPI